MDIIYTSCCGLDVHKRTIQACVRRMGRSGKIHHEVRTFSTMTWDILALADWLGAEEVTHVAMESTGVYWKPVYNILEGRVTILLVNARHVKNVPGRKTDVKDCQWLAQLLQCGLLKGSFIPDRPQRELRDLTRHRSQLVAERTAVANRIHKVLEDTNIKLGSVATDILGTSGREMIRALIAGEQNAEKLADLARKRLREKIPELRLALQGHITDHHRFVLGELMDHIEYLERQIDRFSARIEEISRPFEKAIEAVTRMPGFEKRSAENVIAEIGINMSQFPSAGHLAAWAGMCPGNNESAGKSKGSKTTKGSRWLRCALNQAAWASTHKKGSYFQAKYGRLAGRRGKKRALVAIGHSMLVTIYHLLKSHVEYRDLGSNFFDKLNSKQLVKHHVNRLKSLGYNVTLTETQQQEAA